VIPVLVTPGRTTLLVANDVVSINLVHTAHYTYYVRTICITIVHIRCITCVNNISISVHCPLDVIIIPSVGITRYLLMLIQLILITMLLTVIHVHYSINVAPVNQTDTKM